MLLEEANETCDGNIRCIEQYFYGKDDFEGTLGNVKYRPDGKIEREFYMQTVKNGEFVEME